MLVHAATGEVLDVGAKILERGETRLDLIGALLGSFWGVLTVVGG